MRALSRFILSLLAPWNGFLTASIGSLPGASKSDDEPTRVSLITDPGTPFEQLKPDERAGHYNNQAAESYNKGDFEKAEELLLLASQEDATSDEVINAIKSNKKLIS